MEYRMKTNDLIGLLATDAGAPPPNQWQLPASSLVAAMLSLALVVGVWGLRPDLPDLVQDDAFQFKLLWVLVLMVGSGWVLRRVARPSQRMGQGIYVLVLAFLAMDLAGANAMLQAQPDQRLALMLGRSWWACPVSITLISLPWLGVWLLYLRHMAPTRLAISGAVAGLLSGATATAFYSLHCTETSFAFFSVWYAAGMALSTLLGAVLGARFLRW
jgi:hypothetical protein